MERIVCFNFDKINLYIRPFLFYYVMIKSRAAIKPIYYDYFLILEVGRTTDHCAHDRNSRQNKVKCCLSNTYVTKTHFVLSSQMEISIVIAVVLKSRRKEYLNVHQLKTRNGHGLIELTEAIV